MPEPVALVDRLRSTFLVAVIDLPDEERDVDPCRARIDARRIVAIQAARTLVVRLRVAHQRLLRVEVRRELSLGRGFLVLCHVVRSVDSFKPLASSHKLDPYLSLWLEACG